jgi:hypothetical protein
MRFVLLSLVFAISTTCFCQNYVYKGDEKFIATQSWGFKLTNYHWSSNGLDVSVAKTKTGGYLMLSIEVPFDETISGNVFIILENGSTVTLNARNVNDHVDSKSQVLYVISSTQYQLLKTSSVSKIRISLKNPKGTIGGVAGDYTATNKINEYDLGNEVNSWNTAKEITALDERQE